MGETLERRNDGFGFYIIRISLMEPIIQLTEYNRRKARIVGESEVTWHDEQRHRQQQETVETGIDTTPLILNDGHPRQNGVKS